jgi:hypothetical protein
LSDGPGSHYKDAMSRPDRQECLAWAEAYNQEYCAFKEQNAFKFVCPEPVVEIRDTLTKLEYKKDNGTYLRGPAA